MKKIFALIILLAFCGSLFAQATTTPQRNTTSKLGKYTDYKDASGNYVSQGFHLTNAEFTYYVRSADTWGAAKDTSSYNFYNLYREAYVTIYDSSATADTLVFEHYSYAKNDWTTQAIGFRDVLTDYLEADNTTVIIAGATAKTYKINMERPGQVRVRPKTLTGRTTLKTKRVVFTGVN